jgi:hypothetical protein
MSMERTVCHTIRKVSQYSWNFLRLFEFVHWKAYILPRTKLIIEVLIKFYFNEVSQERNFFYFFFFIGIQFKFKKKILLVNDEKAFYVNTKGQRVEKGNKSLQKNSLGQSKSSNCLQVAWKCLKCFSHLNWGFMMNLIKKLLTTREKVARQFFLGVMKFQ